MSKQKIRVVFYCNQLGIGGTERSIELFCKYLNKDKHDVYVVSRIQNPSFLKKVRIEVSSLLGFDSAKAKKQIWSQQNTRVPRFQALLGEERTLFAKDDLDLRKILLKLSPDILHVWYSGTPEPPTSDEEIMGKLPVVITTNSFEIENTAPAHRHVKEFFFPSSWVLNHKALWAKNDPRAGVFYSPIEKPLTNNHFREKLQIPAHAFVVGRVGRADPGIYDPLSLFAYKKIQDEKTFFLALTPPHNMVRDAKKMGLKNFICFQALDQEGLSAFYNTLDVLAHGRRDGETFGCSIAEAMMHGKPVVSHLTKFMNAQQEVIGEGGFVCQEEDWQAYADRLEMLKDPALRESYGEKAFERALQEFEVEKLTQRLEQLYQKHFNIISCRTSSIGAFTFW